MAAMVLKGHGGVEKLEYHTDWPTPQPKRGEVLVQITATAKNNTDRKVREGLYPTKSKDEVTSFSMAKKTSLSFPRIQGADVVGRIVAVGEGVDKSRIGERGLLDFNLYPDDREDLNLMPDYFGHGADGGFAEYGVFPSEQFHAINNPEISDAQLSSLGMCSYQTGLHMLTSANVKKGERVLVTGASGGVGTALIQMCRALGAIPYALSSLDKKEALMALGAEDVCDRSEKDLLKAILKMTGGKPIDAVMDLLGGEYTDIFIDSMINAMDERSTYPRLSIAGAGASNVSEILWTRIYLYQVQIFGVSHGTRKEAKQLIEWIRGGQIKPVLHGAFKLSDLRKAEEYFAKRGSGYLGKICIVPDSQWETHGKAYAIEV
jgi:NADPH:quinone reductase-like Zn-dependent oxidoreductase